MPTSALETGFLAGAGQIPIGIFFKIPPPRLGSRPGMERPVLQVDHLRLGRAEGAQEERPGSHQQEGKDRGAEHHSGRYSSFA